MIQQRKNASAAHRKSAAAAPHLRDVADPALFFSLDTAQFCDAIAVTKVISVVLPLRHLRDRTILHEMVLKKLLHRSFEPSADDLAQQQQQQHEQEVAETGVSGPSPPTAGPPSPPSPGVYTIVHITSVEVHADTARQVNPQGDVQVNVMTTLVAARLRHGLVAGVAEPSAFASCMQVRLPTVAVSAAVAANEKRRDTDALTLDSVRLDDGGQVVDEQEKASSPLLPSQSGEVPVDRQLRVTARCLEDEPVMPGQAVLLVSEPAAIRCLAVRPPRDAPGPFFFAEDTTVEPAGVAAATAKRKRTSRRAPDEGQGAASEKMSAKAGRRRVVVIACDIPEAAGKADGGRKRLRS
ncbi:hypothetical protein ABL78_1000 [Leptomonas seymouri]|uniref:ICAM-like surface protein n=1 Tax=Leptomonas seymouri TaxID=5684 RepID=A0A0N1IMI6_LEPSE|nr:hypothetical protein ABL78_1000 [Leptomonas seymouri]|eukprot:KPI89928.1 hypothetical protein ABL78_1000 [Leptomonas seymouri]